MTERSQRAVRTVLVVDDSRTQRLLLAAGLRGVGYAVLQAESGTEALELCARHEVDLILSDWMMPGMNGIELCRALRAGMQARYVYFILLTSRTDKGAVAEGLEVGADDFLTKPVDAAELRARIKAGDRLLSLERELRGNNQLLTDALSRLQELYQTLDQELAEARTLQLSLVPYRTRRVRGGQVSLRLRSSGHVGGDMVGAFDMDGDRLGLYSIDVSGHGMAAALLTTRLAGLFTGSSAGRNIALSEGADGPVPRDPALIAAKLNHLMLSELQSERYLTLGYAEIDLRSGAARLVQSGHPHPLIQRADGSILRLGDGGLPLGLFEGADWTTIEARLEPGDRLLMMSDGVIECPDPRGVELGQDGVEDLMRSMRDLRGQALIEALTWEMARWAGSEDFPDDVSFALFEYDGLAAHDSFGVSDDDGAALAGPEIAAPPGVGAHPAHDRPGVCDHADGAPPDGLGLSPLGSDAPALTAEAGCGPPGASCPAAGHAATDTGRGLASGCGPRHDNRQADGAGAGGTGIHLASVPGPRQDAAQGGDADDGSDATPPAAGRDREAAAEGWGTGGRVAAGPPASPCSGDKADLAGC